MINQVPRAADHLFHDLLETPELRNVRAEVRDFAARVVTPVARDIAERDESVETFPRDVFAAMAEAGLFAIPFAAADGGRGLAERVTATAIAIEELAYVSNSVAAIYDVHCILAGRTLEGASEDLRRRFLMPLIAGTMIGAFATTEPEASSDLSPQRMSTVARREGSGYVVSGHKRWITNSPVADFIIVLCRTPENQLVELVVDAKADGVRIGRPDLKLGNRGQLTADVILDNVWVDDRCRIGAEGEGLRIALQTLTYGRIGIAATGVGMAQAAFDHSVRHLKTRHAFGRPIGQFQHWQFRMADHAIALENARSLYLKAARRMDQGTRFPEPESAMAKAYATELAVTLARDAIQVHGGYGFMRELAFDGSWLPLEAIYRDAKIAEIYEGTNEIQRLIVARSIFGRDFVA